MHLTELEIVLTRFIYLQYSFDEESLLTLFFQILSSHPNNHFKKDFKAME